MKTLEQYQDLTAGENSIFRKENDEKQYVVYYADTIFYKYKFDSTKQRLKSISFGLPRFSEYIDDIEKELRKVFDIHSIEKYSESVDEIKTNYNIIMDSELDYPKLMEEIYNIIQRLI